MDWVQEFYSITGRWWVKADARVTDRDHARVRQIDAHCGTGPFRILELGAGYGTTAVATAHAGHTVTAVEISDRADSASVLTAGLEPGRLTVIKDDFYRVRFDEPFDVICYWNGFGIGSDANQRALLTRIAAQWLRPNGFALIDIQNPFVWASWDGDDEHLLPDEGAGYEFELRERTTFDPLTCTAIDTWWEVDDPEHKITQTLRCYTPADLTLLLAGTGLALSTVAGADPSASTESVDLLRDHHEYLAVLRHDRS